MFKLSLSTKQTALRFLSSDSLKSTVLNRKVAKLKVSHAHTHFTAVSWQCQLDITHEPLTRTHA